MNATASGTAVSASAALCSVSPSSATDPDAAATAACTAAVPARMASDTHSTRIPSALDSSAGSTWSAGSCECGCSACTTRDTAPARPVACA
jgi:hypothetical protein